MIGSLRDRANRVVHGQVIGKQDWFRKTPHVCMQILTNFRTLKSHDF